MTDKSDVSSQGETMKQCVSCGNLFRYPPSDNKDYETRCAYCAPVDPSQGGEQELSNNDDNVEVVRGDLGALLFWASVGVHSAKGGYKEEEMPHILDSYAEAIAFTLPHKPKFQSELLPSFSKRT